MSFVQALIEVLRRIASLFDPRVRKADRVRNTLSKSSGRPTIEVSLYQSDSLIRHRGRTPERTVARFLSKAIDDAGFDYRIDYGYTETFDPPEESNSVDAFNWWVENGPARSENSNLLLYDARGGGRAAVTGKRGIVGVNRVKRLADPRRECTTDLCGNVRAALHEVGHNLGGRHKTPILEDRPSMLYHDNAVELFHDRLDGEGG